MGAIIFWIVLCGVAGGIRNSLGDLRSDQNRKPLLVLQRLVEGVVAAATVPLFLSLIGNDVVGTILDSHSAGTKEWFYATLKFAGFCLIAAVYSRSYLDGLSAKVIQLEKDLKTSEKVTDSKLAQISDQVEVAIVEDGAPTGTAAVLAPPASAGIAAKEKTLLLAFMNYPYPIRSIKGLAMSTGFTETEVLEILNILETRQLVRSVETRNGTRWAATPVGHDAVKTNAGPT